MTGLTFPTLTAIAHSLVANRKFGATALAAWEGHHRKHGVPHAKEIAARCRTELAAIDNALLELQAVAPPFLNDFLKHQIDLIQQATPAAQPSTKEAS